MELEATGQLAGRTLDPGSHLGGCIATVSAGAQRGWETSRQRDVRPGATGRLISCLSGRLMRHSTPSTTQTLWILGIERSDRTDSKHERSCLVLVRSQQRHRRKLTADHCEGTTACSSAGIGRSKHTLARLHQRRFERGLEPSAVRAKAPQGVIAGARSNPKRPPTWNQPGTNNPSRHKPMEGSGL